MNNAILISVRTAKPPVGLVAISYKSSRNYSSEEADYKNVSLYKRGTGGRSSFNGIVATVFGCTGFLGRYVCNRLGKIGTQLILPYRGDNYEPMRLKVVGDLGQVYFHHYNLKDEDSIRKAMLYSNVVINLVGREWETRNFSFDDVHVEGARRLARIAKESGVERFIHLSSLNAAEDPEPVIMKSGSPFLRSKALGEAAVLEEFPTATIFRPSDIYGQEDRFTRYYLHWFRRTYTMLPLWHKGEKTVKQPVHVSDVAAGIVAAVRDPDTAGKIYQAIGPKRYLLSELVDYIYRVTRRDGEDWGYQRYDMRWDPFFQMRIGLNQKLTFSWPLGNLHWDKVEREHVTDAVDYELPTLEDLGVNLATVEDRFPWELKHWTWGLYHDEEGQVPTPAPPKVVV